MITSVAQLATTHCCWLTHPLYSLNQTYRTYTYNTNWCLHPSLANISYLSNHHIRYTISSRAVKMIWRFIYFSPHTAKIGLTILPVRRYILIRQLRGNGEQRISILAFVTRCGWSVKFSIKIRICVIGLQKGILADVIRSCWLN